MRKWPLVIFLTLVVSVAVWGATCENYIADINDCGDYPPSTECILINWDVLPQGCCSPPAHNYQNIKREWYDCTGDGESDCEYQIHYYEEDLSCP